MRYGEEFRPIRELSAGVGQSAGQVTLVGRGGPPRASEYALHPVSLRWRAASILSRCAGHRLKGARPE